MDSRDIVDIEARFCTLTRSERPDPQFLHSLEWFTIRRKLIRFLDEGATDAISIGDRFRMTPGMQLVVLGAYPAEGHVAEVELFHE